jgi:hypothetical protein
MEPSDYGEIPLSKILYFVEVWVGELVSWWVGWLVGWEARELLRLYAPITGGIKYVGTRNGSENGRRAWVALCAHHTHTDIDSDKVIFQHLFRKTEENHRERVRVLVSRTRFKPSQVRNMAMAFGHKHAQMIRSSIELVFTRRQQLLNQRYNKMSIKWEWVGAIYLLSP